MKICPVVAELFHAHGKIDGWTDRQPDRQRDKRNEANSIFRNFTNASTNWTESLSHRSIQQIT